MSSVAFAQDTPALIQQGTQPAPIQVQQGSTPVPDPTKLTTEAVSALRSQLLELINVQLAALTKDLERLQLEVDERPSRVLVDEKFQGVNEQFAGRDVALAAALLAQKTSVADQNNSNLIAADKAEKSFIEQIRGIQAIIDQQEKSQTDKIDDLRLRLTSIEAGSKGSGDAINWIVIGAGFILTVITIISVVIGIVAAVRSFGNNARAAPAAVTVVPLENNGNSSRGRRT
jgi:Na+-transporting methylmalonyl-CoA/oxaloacetate decarboxylase gamma subunit